VHPRTGWISKLRQGVCDVPVEEGLVAGRQLEDSKAATTRRGKAAVPSRLDPRIGEVRDIVPAPDNVEADAIGTAILDCICVVIAHDARSPALIVPGNYSSNHDVPPRLAGRAHITVIRRWANAVLERPRSHNYATGSLASSCFMTVSASE